MTSFGLHPYSIFYVKRTERVRLAHNKHGIKRNSITQRNSFDATMQKKSRSRSLSTGESGASFTQRARCICIAIQRDAHAGRDTPAAGRLVHCSRRGDGRVREKYTVYSRRRIARNITADSSAARARARDYISIFFQRPKARTLHAGNARLALGRESCKRATLAEWRASH